MKKLEKLPPTDENSEKIETNEIIQDTRPYGEILSFQIYLDLVKILLQLLFSKSSKDVTGR